MFRFFIHSSIIFCLLCISDFALSAPGQEPGAAVVNADGRYADIVIEPNSGHVLHASHASSPRHPASLTKMMTLYLTFKALKEGKLHLDQPLIVSAYAASQPATKLGLKAGQVIAVRDAVMSLITLSANDSAVVLAEALAGNVAGFGVAMTAQAAQLGMTQSHFYNPSGLPNPNQMTTAYDMAMLAAALIKYFPEYYDYFSSRTFSYGGATYHNHNHLMDRYSGMDGIKTGYIESSGFNLVASAKRGDKRLIGVVFGGSSPASRDQRMAQLLNAGFNTLAQQQTQANTTQAQTNSTVATGVSVSTIGR